MTVGELYVGPDGKLHITTGYAINPGWSQDISMQMQETFLGLILTVQFLMIIPMSFKYCIFLRICAS